MVFCEATRLVPAPPERVWAVIADLARLKEWLPIQAEFSFPGGMQAASGTSIHVRRPSNFGLVELDQIIERCEPPACLSWRNANETLAGKPVQQIKDFNTILTLALAAPEQTHITVRSEWTPVGVLGSIATSLLKPRLQRECGAALENIERLALLK